MNRTEKFIKKAKKIYGNETDYSKMIYTNCKKKINIICLKHNTEYQQTPDSHLQGKQSCPDCKEERKINAGKNRRKTTKQFIEESKKIHGDDKYDYSKTNYEKATKEVIIICKIHGEFKQTPDSHLHGHGCKSCAQIVIANKRRKPIEQFIEEANKIHRNKYDYSKVNYKNSDTYITIICPIHGEFEQTPASHLCGRGCNDCGNIRAALKNTFTKEQFIKKSKENLKCRDYDNNYYDYSNCIYTICKNKVENIYCNRCKKYFDVSCGDTHYTQGTGCKDCSKLKTIERLRSTKEEFVTRSKNNPKCRDCEGNYFNYDYVNYIDAKTKVDIYCNYHNKSFSMIPNNHSCHGQICFRCSKNKKYSEPACEWIEGIMKNEGINIQYAKSEEGEYHIPGTRYYADGYCEETKTIYEFHGDYWHGNPNNKKNNMHDINKKIGKKFGTLFINTCIREFKLRERGYNYVCMWESDY